MTLNAARAENYRAGERVPLGHYATLSTVSVCCGSRRVTLASIGAARSVTRTSTG